MTVTIVTVSTCKSIRQLRTSGTKTNVSLVLERWSPHRSEVKINCTSTIGTQPSGLYGEKVSGCKWSLNLNSRIQNITLAQARVVTLSKNLTECSNMVYSNSHVSETGTPSLVLNFQSVALGELIELI